MKARIPFKMTVAQQRAMHREIERQLAEHMRKYEAEYIALALYAARVEFGFGKKRLERLKKRCMSCITNLYDTTICQTMGCL